LCARERNKSRDLDHSMSQRGTAIWGPWGRIRMPPSFLAAGIKRSASFLILVLRSWNADHGPGADVLILRIEARGGDVPERPGGAPRTRAREVPGAYGVER